jgi:hypothetical protein
MNILMHIILPAARGPGFTQPLREINIETEQMFVGSKARPVRKANNLTAICEPVV